MSETLTPEAAAQPSLLERWRPQIGYQGISLAIICALMTLMMLVGDQMTSASIEVARKEEQLATLRQVIPADLFDNQPLDDAFSVDDEVLGKVQVFPAKKNGQLMALAFQVSNIGYGGPITHLVALNADGVILGVRVLTHKETPGLADKIEVSRSNWIKSFDGLSLANTPLEKWKVKKDGGMFDQFAGATITPRAVVKSVLQALQFHTRHIAEISRQEVKP